LTSVSVSGNSNIGNIGTGLITATGNITGANLITGGLLTVTGNAQAANVIATTYNLTGVTTGISAAGSSQGDATALTKAFKHICWDGCMFPNEVMTKQQTWNDILASMIKVRDQHGWYEAE